jgi:hexulose-6-phosphate isomerase
MQYGLNQTGFPSDEFERICSILAAAGYDGVEPNVERNGPLTTESGRQEACRIVDEHDLSVSAVSTIEHWEYPLSSADRERRETGLQISRNMIDAAAALGADDVLVVPAVIDADTSYERGYERAVRAVRELADYAADREVTVAIENVQNNFLPSPREFVEFLDDVDDAGPIAAYFDVGNAFRSGLPTQWLRALDGHISKVHVKDWFQQGHRPTYPLQGDIDWGRVVAAMNDTDYDGWITAEIPPYPSYPERMPRQVLENMRFLFEDAGAGNGTRVSDDQRSNDAVGVDGAGGDDR